MTALLAAQIVAVRTGDPKDFSGMAGWRNRFGGTTGGSGRRERHRRPV